MTRTHRYLHRHICYVPRKQVRSLFLIAPVRSFANSRLLVGAVTAIMTNPIWVVKVRMFTTKPGSSTAYRSLWRKFFVTCLDSVIFTRDIPAQTAFPPSIIQKAQLGYFVEPPSLSLVSATVLYSLWHMRR